MSQYGDRQDWSAGDYAEYLEEVFLNREISSSEFNAIADECNERYGPDL